jgi:hypothetical protein
MRQAGGRDTRDRCFIRCIAERARAVTLVETQAGRVLFAHHRVGACNRVIRKAFEEQTVSAHAQRLVANVFVKRRADTAAGKLLSRGQIVEIGKRQLRVVQHDGEALHLPRRVLGDVQHGAESPIEGVAELIAELVDVFRRRAGKMLEKDFRHLIDRGAIDGQEVFVNSPDAEQVEVPV